MAIIRLEQRDDIMGKRLYEGIVEETADLDDMAEATADPTLKFAGSSVNPVAPGSLFFCAEDKKIYAMLADGTFKAVKE